VTGQLKRSGARLLFVACACLAFAGVGETSASPAVHTVAIDKMKFGPLPKTLRAGDTILWVNKDLFKHTATAQDRSFNIDLAPKTSGKTVIKRAGAIPFYCIYHPGMKGSLTVAR
jgi:plastocyanin